MKNILNIFKTDLKNISKNWVALILIGGLTFLPSLYAWFNIAAMWDPYSKTGDLPVAIVNEDTGSAVRDKEIDVGKNLVEELKDNKSLDWHFLERKEAMKELEYGDLFAVIVIPENFSESLGTVLSMKPEKATVEYYVNEKINSISPKITEKGASVIVDQVSSKFISTVNGIIFDIFNEIGIELESELPDIKKFEDYVFTLEEHLPEIGTTLEESLADAKSAQELLGDAEDAIPDAKKIINDGIATIDETYSMITQAEKRLDELSPQVREDLKKLQEITSKVNDFLDKVEESGVDLQEGLNLQEELEKKIDDSIATLDTVEAALLELKKLSDLGIEVEIPKPNLDPEEGTGNNQVEDKEETTKGEESKDDNSDQQKVDEVLAMAKGITHPPQPAAETETVVKPNPITPEQIDEALEKTAKMKAELEASKKDLDQLGTFIDDMNKDVDAAFADLRQIATNTSTQLDSFVKEYTERIEAEIYSQINKAKLTLIDAKDMLTEALDKFPEIERILASTKENLTDGETALEFVQGEFPYVNQKVLELAKKIRDLQDETNLNEIIDLLKNDPEAEENFFEEPVVMHENTLFPMENYGTGMTPFYTVLAVWVGGLLLISLLSVDVPQVGEYTARHIYFGKLLTFLMIGLLQTFIVTMGDIFILGVTPQHPVWMVLFALLCSVIFITIIYTLVSVFGNVGKSLAIIMLVLQLSASGGTYPVELLPGFFQAISPFLPFTYAVDLMREAIGGIVWKRVYIDVGVLLAIVSVFLILGTFFKEKLSKGGKIIMEKSKESGLFH